MRSYAICACWIAIQLIVVLLITGIPTRKP